MGLTGALPRRSDAEAAAGADCSGTTTSADGLWQRSRPALLVSRAVNGRAVRAPAAYRRAFHRMGWSEAGPSCSEPAEPRVHAAAGAADTTAGT
eukprot:SAG31_NODE_643_length_13291_cov_6.294042_8_plen_94_part_00